VVARCDPAANRCEGQRNPWSGGGQKCLIGGNPSGLLRLPYAVTCLHVGVALTGSSFQVPTFPPTPASIKGLFLHSCNPEAWKYCTLKLAV